MLFSFEAAKPIAAGGGDGVCGADGGRRGGGNVSAKTHSEIHSSVDGVMLNTPIITPRPPAPHSADSLSSLARLLSARRGHSDMARYSVALVHECFASCVSY